MSHSPDDGQGVTWGEGCCHIWAVRGHPAPPMERRTALGHLMPVGTGPRVPRLRGRRTGRPFRARLVCDAAQGEANVGRAVLSALVVRGSSATVAAGYVTRGPRGRCEPGGRTVLSQLWGERVAQIPPLAEVKVQQATDKRHGTERGQGGTGGTRRTAAASLHGEAVRE